ncbi:hypothetical protein K402DRAFT_307396, partial [Aulographum hederae CBS 113979]
QKYICTSCEVKFTRKWDWKHHEEVSHERWRKFACPDCNQTFWSDNQFNQHHRTAHECRKCSHAGSAQVMLKKRSAWGCGFCGVLHQNWDERCNHIAQHYESGKTKANWKHSNVIWALLHQPDIKLTWRAFLLHKFGNRPTPRPRFEWDRKDSGRSQEITEVTPESPLQDLLEFDGDHRDIKIIIQRAFVLGYKA